MRDDQCLADSGVLPLVVLAGDMAQHRPVLTMLRGEDQGQECRHEALVRHRDQVRDLDGPQELRCALGIDREMGGRVHAEILVPGRTGTVTR